MKSLFAIVMMTGASMTSAAPLIGEWSGDRATLTLTATGGRFVEDCAAATIDGPVSSDARGGFSARGHREIHTPGPQDADAPPPIRPVRFIARQTATGLALEVRDGDGTAHAYNLMPGRRFKRMPCL
ncbi:hypothetical protein [Glacieibacterium frigidum]|uniref:Uncharacterized protein n=1 Tax=Glacieibacterium frigidum TaxID=2593303 RepID=A0A552UGF1_9SPHN|nr:hypothetical protein [Glacieibacterium frigidum]TRW17271.1 hypothetical protein FMM06_03540 [Glacieibacterium frigidum]